MQIKPVRTDNENKSIPFIKVDAPSGDWTKRDEKGYYFEMAFTDRSFKVYINEILSGGNEE